MKIIYCIFFVFILTSCTNNDIIKDSIKDSIIDSLKTVIQTKETEINWIKNKKPSVIIENQEASTCAINLFYPFGLKIEIVDKRPENDGNTFLSVACAYTSKSGTIDGIFVKNGTLINKEINKSLTGVCIVNNNAISIAKSDIINNSLLKKVLNEKNTLFQQTLLIKNSQLVECNLFGSSINLRRALIKLDENKYFVGESHRPMTIIEFQNALKEIGAIDAVNLDMGSWSEGWYIRDNEKISIGDNFINTKRQTNWLTFNIK